MRTDTGLIDWRVATPEGYLVRGHGYPKKLIVAVPGPSLSISSPMPHCLRGSPLSQSL